MKRTSQLTGLLDCAGQSPKLLRWQEETCALLVTNGWLTAAESAQTRNPLYAARLCIGAAGVGNTTTSIPVDLDMLTANNAETTVQSNAKRTGDTR